MIKGVVAFALANVQQTKALVLECCRVGWTHRLLIWRTVVITNTSGIKSRESFADGMVIASNICARVNIFETKYKITSYDRNLTNFFPQLLLEIFLKQKVLKIIHFWEKYYPIRHAGRDLSQKNYKRLHFLRASLHVYMSKKLVLFRFSFLFSVLKIACYLD